MKISILYIYIYISNRLNFHDGKAHGNFTIRQVTAEWYISTRPRHADDQDAFAPGESGLGPAEAVTPVMSDAFLGCNLQSLRLTLDPEIMVSWGNYSLRLANSTQVQVIQALLTVEMPH